jgi:hypothetical protein
MHLRNDASRSPNSTSLSHPAWRENSRWPRAPVPLRDGGSEESSAAPVDEADILSASAQLSTPVNSVWRNLACLYNLPDIHC